MVFFTCDQVSLLFLVKDVQRHLQRHGLHVIPLEGGGDVHVHVQEPVHVAALLLLLYLQRGQEVDEPLEAGVVPVDPEEVDLLEVEHVGHVLTCPGVTTLGTGGLTAQVSVHDGLQDGGEGSDSYTK